MVKKQHKFLCLILCLVLVLTTVTVGAVSVFAASGDTVYVRVNNGWNNIHCYMWNGDQKNAEWPGVAMTQVSGDIYSYQLNGNYSKIIFNKGSGGNGNQTNDMDYPGANKIYDLSASTWSDYSGGDTPTSPVPTTPQPDGDYVVYFKNTDNWSSVKCYMWNSDSDNNAAWSGEAMTNLGDGVWMYTAKKKFASCIFNNGGGVQTGNLTAQYGQIYDYGTKSWSVYDTSDLRISSFTADPDSDIYTGTEVTLTANAANKKGATVYYKFSVTNAAGSSSVISDFSSANTVFWTPTNAGNYTLTLDVKDSEGNENSRTLSLSVASDAGVTSPIIKMVTPKNLNLVKKGREATVSVSAGGGKTGTQLLFYKYIVTDPNGVPNTPYYTRNATYSFTPSKLGDYTVEVFVQASDNSTVSKVYHYTSTDGDVTEPTTLKPQDPTTQPTTAQQWTSAPTDPVTVPVESTTTPDGYQRGDADKDHFVNIKDATYVQKHCAEYPDAREIDLKTADMNNDNKITIVDATLIQILIAS